MVTSVNRSVEGLSMQDNLEEFPETVCDLRYRADFVFYVIEVETGQVSFFCLH